MQIRFGAELADALLLGAGEFLKACDDLPNIGASGERGAPIVGWTAENNARVIKLVDALNYELIQQRGGARSLASGTRRQAALGSVADAK